MAKNARFMRKHHKIYSDQRKRSLLLEKFLLLDLNGTLIVDLISQRNFPHLNEKL